MIDSTNPRILADNIRAHSDAIRELQDAQIIQAAELAALGLYSTDEVDTGMKWVDNSPIYRKSFVINSLPDTNLMSVSHGIENLSLVVSINGVIKYGTGFTLLPRVAIDSSTLATTASSVSVSINDTAIIIRTYSDQTSNSAYVTFEYTKSAAPAALTSPAPDDTRSIEPEEIPEDEYIEPEVIKEAPEEEVIIEEPIQEVKKTTRKKSTN